MRRLKLVHDVGVVLVWEDGKPSPELTSKLNGFEYERRDTLRELLVEWMKRELEAEVMVMGRTMDLVSYVLLVIPSAEAMMLIREAIKKSAKGREVVVEEEDDGEELGGVVGTL